MNLAETFAQTIQILEDQGYFWEPLAPAAITRERARAGTLPPAIRYFGLGADLQDSELDTLLGSDAHPRGLMAKLKRLRPGFARYSGGAQIDVWVAFHHRMSSAEQGAADGNFVYLGPESFRFLRKLDPASFAGKRVLDLGSGSGILALAAARAGADVVGVDSSPAAVAWAGAMAEAQGLKARFIQHVIARDSDTGRAIPHSDLGEFDLVLCNPPMAIASPGSPRPFRDGGELGIELPLLFLDFAHAHLRAVGEVRMLASNPIVSGRDSLFEALKSSPWALVEKDLFDPSFNQALAKNDRYSELGIERIELWSLKLRRKP